MVSACKLLVNTMIDLGVKHIFGIPGGAVLPIYDALYDVKDRIDVVVFRHEQGAVHAADAYARVIMRPGVTIVTSGPGATNLLTGLANAYMDSSPVVAVTGQVPTSMIGRDAFQETDIVSAVTPVTKFCVTVRDARRLPKMFEAAYRIAMHGRPGPTLIDVPRDVQTADVDGREVEAVVMPGLERGSVEPDMTLISMAAKLIIESERPVILVGGGVYWSRAWNEVIKLAELICAPIVTTLPGKNSVPNDHPLVLGPIGMHGRIEAIAAVVNSDLIIALGTRFSDRTVCNYQELQRGRKIIHVDIDRSEIGKNVKPTVGIVGDVKRAVSRLLGLLSSAKMKDPKFIMWLKEVGKRFEEHVERLADELPGLAPWRALKVLRDVVPRNAIVTTGVGAHQMWCNIYWKVLEPGTFITSAGLGTMGFGLPAAIGAKFARPDVPVVDIDGDGSFLMTVQNLAVVRERNLDIIVVIFNNRAFQMVRQWQKALFHGRIIAVDLDGNPDFVRLAESFGIEGARPEGYDELRACVARAIRSRQPLVVDLTLDRESEVVLPWVQPGRWLSDVIPPRGFEVSLKYGEIQ